MTNVDVDTSEAYQELEELKQTSDLTAAGVASTVRKSYESIVLLSDLFGIVIPMYYQLMASMLFMAGETFVELATAEAASGWLAAKSSVTFAIALMLLYRAETLRQTGERISNKLNTNSSPFSVIVFLNFS